MCVFKLIAINDMLKRSNYQSVVGHEKTLDGLSYRLQSSLLKTRNALVIQTEIERVYLNNSGVPTAHSSYSA